MQIRLIRHATFIVEMNGRRLLVDPVFGSSGSIAPIPGVDNQTANPLVELVVDLASLIEIDSVLVTHTHIDHFDDVARSLLPKDIQIFCQPADQPNFIAAGFQRIEPVEESVAWEGLTIKRTGGQHGTGRLAEKMGPVSGFVLSSVNEPTLYVTGDTIWCPQVEAALQENFPQVIVCFAGKAQFASGDPITMSQDDIVEVCKAAPMAKVVVVHMEAWNHCRLSRQELSDFISVQGLKGQVTIPGDGEFVNV